MLAGPGERIASRHTSGSVRRGRCKEFTDAEGAWNVIARGTADAGVAFRAAHRPIVDAMFKAARAEGRHEPYEAYAFDAFIELARRAANARGRRRRHLPKTRRRTGQRRRRRRRRRGILRSSGSITRRCGAGRSRTTRSARSPGSGPIPVSVARELLGDAILKLVITKGVDVANVTHLGRSVTVAQQVALWWQAPECTRSGCTRTHRLENDHREDWIKTKHTRLDETDPLCGHDHDLKTYQGWALVSRHRQTTNGPTPRPPPPETQTTTRPVTNRRQPNARGSAAH